MIRFGYLIILTQSDRESDVLTAIRRGASGYLLKSSTISHIRTIYEKLNVTNAPAAITKAYRSGLFPP